MYNLLALIILILTTFIQPSVKAQVYPSNPPSENLTLLEFGCQASNSRTLIECLQEVKRTGMPLIKIVAPIICESRADCSFVMKDINRQFEISPTKPENKIIRKNDFGYTLLAIENSSGAKFKDLTFVDEGETPCPSATACPPLITIKNSSNFIFENTDFFRTKATALTIADSRDISITDSTFEGGAKTAIEVSSKVFAQGIKIDNNTFNSNASSAIVFQTVSLTANPSSISDNNFVNNHARGVYLSCTYPCSGGQIRIIGPTSNLNLLRNKINGGPNTIFDTLGLYASGVEFGGQNLTSIKLFCNEISGNRGSGIVQSPPFVNLKEIQITENKIFGNGLNLNIPGGTTDENNCFTRECTLGCMAN